MPRCNNGLFFLLPLVSVSCAVDVWDDQQFVRQTLVSSCLTQCRDDYRDRQSVEGDSFTLAQAYASCVTESCGTSATELLELVDEGDFSSRQPEVAASLARAWLLLPESRAHEVVPISIELLRQRYPELASELDQAVSTGQAQLTEQGRADVRSCAESVGLVDQQQLELLDEQTLAIYEELLVEKRLSWEIENLATQLEQAAATGRPAKYSGCGGFSSLWSRLRWSGFRPSRRDDDWDEEPEVGSRSGNSIGGLDADQLAGLLDLYWRSLSSEWDDEEEDEDEEESYSPPSRPRSGGGTSEEADPPLTTDKTG